MRNYGFNLFRLNISLSNSLILFSFMFIFTVNANINSNDDIDSIKEKIDLAILKFEQTDRKSWSYTVSRYENEEGDITSSIEHYSPRNNEAWLLEKINGKRPTKKQLKAFSKKKNKQKKTANQKNKQESDIKISLRELINPDSLSLVSVEEQQMTLAFNVNWKKLGKDSIGKLQGHLTYQKDQQFIDNITIWNNAEFSPMFTANITDLVVTFSFMQINNSVLAKSNEMKMKGSFAYFTEINETSLDSYSDYIYQGIQKNMDK